MLKYGKHRIISDNLIFFRPGNRVNDFELILKKCNSVKAKSRFTVRQNALMQLINTFKKIAQV